MMDCKKNNGGNRERYTRSLITGQHDFYIKEEESI